jgi:hypothetical protein
VGEVAGAVCRVQVAGPVRDEDLDGLAEQFVAVVAEQPFGLGVDQGDAAVRDDADDGVGGGLQQPAELCLGPGCGR